MNTKTCKNCGWVYPITQPGRKCLICGAVFPVIVCTTCHKPTPIEKMESGTWTCKACAAAHDKVVRDSKLKFLEDQFDEWVAKINSVPKNYPTLTEEQWLEACRHFDGCARCHSNDIDARGFFVGAELGGRYCDWNVIPLCEKCASTWNLSRSAFRYTLARDHKAHGTEYRECLVKIIEYLGGKLDAASKADKGSTRHTDGD